MFYCLNTRVYTRQTGRIAAVSRESGSPLPLGTRLGEENAGPVFRGRYSGNLGVWLAGVDLLNRVSCQPWTHGCW